MTFNGQHTIVIRAAYSEESLSRYRLELSRGTIIPSLKCQIETRFAVVLRLSRSDPLAVERIALFQSIGVAVNTVFELPDHDGLNLQTRLDDDDAISPDFVQTLQAVARHIRRETAINFPHGVVFEDGRWCRMTHRSSQFLSVLTPSPTLRVFTAMHNQIGKFMPVVQVPTQQRCWCWIRHAGAASPSAAYLSRLPRASRDDKARFAHVDFPAVSRMSRSFHTE